ncbi:MAG: tyrosine-protein phosphatase [Defluviitaleaceae bacterium]|nr:tyrosine-protein phosphatase [Defluviitaleaceae bacterium]
MENFPKRFNLKGATVTNMRELGGYQREDKKVTKYKEFLRSSTMADLTEEHCDYLISYGLKTVIDLRSDYEIARDPSSFADYVGVSYKNIPLLCEKHPQISENITLGELYIAMFEERHNFAEVFAFMAENAEGIILFNCVAGKDRTGVVATLLLMLAGIDKVDILVDYEISSTYNKKIAEEYYSNKFKYLEDEELIKGEISKWQHIMHARPEYIEKFYDAVIKFGGVEEYLRSCGISNKIIEIIKNKVI